MLIKFIIQRFQGIRIGFNKPTLVYFEKPFNVPNVTFLYYMYYWRVAQQVLGEYQVSLKASE
jgi:hypothetical protein